MKLKLAFLLATALIVSPSVLFAQNRGGVINVATIGEPPTLDPMASTADLVGIVTQHIFETLYTFDKEWKTTPLLAESLPEISADGKTYTIKLRAGIKFHDGSDMASDDVVASLDRWIKVASRGKQAASFIDKIEATDPLTVTLTLKQPYAPLVSLLAFNNSAAIILPKEKQEEPMKEFIGTGPYMLKERKADQYIQLVRFDGYKSREGGSNGYGGARHQYLDEIRFVPVPDANTRVEAAVSGQYDYIDSIPVESFDKIKSSSVTEPVVLKPFGYPVFVFNTAEGLAKDVANAQGNPPGAQHGRHAGQPPLAARIFMRLTAIIYPKNFILEHQCRCRGQLQYCDPKGAAKSRQGRRL